MNRLLITAALMLLCGSEARASDPAPKARPAGVKPVIRIMKEEIAARPSRVLLAVEDALTMDEQGACEIVREAILSTRADPRLVGEIVYTALRHAPAMTATIVECALRTAPQASSEIEQAMRRALGKSADKTVTGANNSGEKPDGEQTAAAPDHSEPTGKQASDKGAGVSASGNEGDTLDYFLPGSIGVGGIYLIAPASAAGHCPSGNPCCSGELSPSCLRP